MRTIKVDMEKLIDCLSLEQMQELHELLSKRILQIQNDELLTTTTNEKSRTS